ncbi:MAG: hypothetical protein IPL73_06635 [Candidatus Obscuribacter sp.]|nr:hypothetical protein [Candidatus Obscuribacter sp.]
MSLNLTYIIGGPSPLGVVLYFAWPAFKQMINIKAGNAVSGATKASEKMRAEQLALTADVKKQLTAVATVKGSAEAADREVTAAQALIAKLTGDFKMASEMKASDAAIDALAEKVARPQRPRISGAGSAAAQAQKDLDTAQARLDLSQGSDTDQEIAEISKAAARKSARAQLEAELGITGHAAAPSAPTEQK